MAVCANHPEREASASCGGCGKSFCESCLVAFEKIFLCEACKRRYLAGVEDAPETRPGPRPKDRIVSGQALRRERALGGTPLQYLGGAIALLFALVFVVVIVAALAKPWSSWRKDLRLEQCVDRLVTVGAALERYRVDQGRYPAKLEELVPKYLGSLPMDPFASPPAPPHYEPKNADLGGRVWSVGPDGKDDHGEEPADVVYTLEPPG